VELYGRAVSKEDLTRRVGQISQIAGARASELNSGLAKGVDAIDVKTGTGFAFTALPGRALDIAWASYKGAPLSYISKTGVVAPAHFVEKGAEGFLRNFFAGLLTTAGLSNIGPPVQQYPCRGRLHLPGLARRRIHDPAGGHGSPGQDIRRMPSAASRNHHAARRERAGGARRGRECRQSI